MGGRDSRQQPGPLTADSVGALSSGACIAVHIRSWTDNAIRLSKADARRSADYLLRYPLPAAWCTDVDVELYLRTRRPISPAVSNTGWRSLFLYALCNGWINENTAVVASSGFNGGVEAYFAALGLRSSP